MGWSNYKYRFLPWLLFNVKGRLSPLNKQIPNEDFLCPSLLNDAFKEILVRLRPELNFTDNNELLRSHFGFKLKVSESVKGAGRGVFLSSGSVSPGQILALYPGTIYYPGDPILLQSLFNPYILRCRDGTMIDGKPYGLSGSLFRSISYRDHYPDMTWLKNTATPSNPLNLGQLINNGGTEGANVTYAESNWDLRLNHRLNSLIPNACYAPIHDSTIRIVPIVATKEISSGEELLSSYFTMV